MANKAVLIVDDEADIRELLVVTLSRMGVDADSAASVAEAKTALEHRTYDLALTDMRLPDGEGLDVLPTPSSLVPCSTLPAIRYTLKY